MAFEIYFSISKPVLQILALGLVAGAGVYVVQEIKKEKEIQKAIRSGD